MPLNAAPWVSKSEPHKLLGHHVRKDPTAAAHGSEAAAPTGQFEIAGIGGDSTFVKFDDDNKVVHPWTDPFNDDMEKIEKVLLQSTSKAAGTEPVPPLPTAASETSVLMATSAKAAQPEWIKPAIPGDPTVVGSAASQPLPPRPDPKNDVD